MILICFHSRLSNLRINKNRINHLFLWHFRMFPLIIPIKIIILITTKIQTMGFIKHRVNLDNMEGFNKLKSQVLKNLKIRHKIQTLDLLINHNPILNKVLVDFKLQIMIKSNLKINFVTYRIWAAIQKCKRVIKMLLVEVASKIIIKWEVFHNTLAIHYKILRNFQSIKIHDQTL
jgi:hypothetical protein